MTALILCRRFAFSVSIFFGISSIPAWAASDCNAILVGIYNKTFYDSQTSRLSAVLNILKHYQASTLDQARKIAGDAGITLPIEDIPVQFKVGYKTDSTNHATWSDQLETYFASHTVEQAHFVTRLETVNAGVIDAWKTCMVDRGGLLLIPDIPAPTDKDAEFIVELKYVPLTLETPVPRIKKLGFNPAALHSC